MLIKEGFINKYYMAATLKWFSLATDAEPDAVTYTGNFKIEGDVEISGLVRRGNQVFDAITPQWSNLALYPGRIYYSPGLNKDPNNLYTSVSISSVNLTSIPSLVGPLFISPGLSYEIGDKVKFIYTGDSTKYFTFIVTGYNTNTGAIAGTFDSSSGTGTYNSWNVYLFDPQTRVGIGTLNPDYMLDVNGDIRYTGRLFRDTSEVNFGLGAWIASNISGDNTIFYGGSGTRVGIGSGFGSTLTTQTASGTLHLWDELSTGSWNAYYGLRIGPELTNTSFVQIGVTTNSHGWIQTAHTGSSLGSHSSRPLVLNPVGGNIGIGTTDFTTAGLLTLNHVDSSANRYPNGNYRTIQLTRGTEQRNLITSDKMALMFDDVTFGSVDPRVYLLAKKTFTSWEVGSWENSVVMSMVSNGNVGIGTTNPEMKLHVHSQSSCGIIFKNTGIIDPDIYGIERKDVGLVLGRYGGSGALINDVVYNSSTGLTVTGNTNTTGSYRVSGVEVLNGTTLGSNIINSNLQTLGELSQNTTSSQAFVSRLGAVFGSSMFWLNDSSSAGVAGRRFGIGLINTSSINDFVINSYDDFGSFIGPKMIIKRTSGEVQLAGHLYVNDLGKSITLGPGWLYSSGSGAAGTPSTSYTDTFSIYANNAITGLSYYARSDERIKKNIRNIGNVDAIDIVRKLQPVVYDYIDPLKGRTKYGFIAQQVKQHLPEAINHTKEFVPSIYKLVDVGEDHLSIILEDIGSIKSDSCLRFIMKDNLHKEVKVMSIENNVVKFDEQLPEDYDKVFLYGMEVDDFHNLDDSCIVSVNTAAIKELDRENQELKRRVESLEARLEMLLSRLNVSQ